MAFFLGIHRALGFIYLMQLVPGYISVGILVIEHLDFGIDVVPLFEHRCRRRVFLLIRFICRDHSYRDGLKPCIPSRPVCRNWEIDR